MDRLALWDFGFDCVEEADELLVPVTLHTAADNLTPCHV
jgi:hypothetical protein